MYGANVVVNNGIVIGATKARAGQKQVRTLGAVLVGKPVRRAVVIGLGDSLTDSAFGDMIASRPTIWCCFYSRWNKAVASVVRQQSEEHQLV
jgi:hypothetical protein